MKNKIVAVIPARSGSKRVKNKNIRELNGQPLIAYSILDSLRSKLIKQTIVSTDSEEIANIAIKYGADVPFLRPANLASDTSTDMDWILHFLEWYKEEEGDYPKYLVHLRPTSPIREPSIIDNAISKFILYKEASSMRSIEELPESPYKCFKMEKEFLQPILPLDIKEYYNLPNQMFPKTYKANGYIDVLKTNTILRGSLHGNKILAYVTPRIPEIDTEEDFLFAEHFYKKVIEQEQKKT